MKQLLIFFILMFIVGFIPNAYAPDKLKFHVHLDVTCEHKDTKAFIESHIKREIRSLQDVRFVSESAENYNNIFDLWIVAIEPTYKSGSKVEHKGGQYNSGLWLAREVGNIILAYGWREKFSNSYIRKSISEESWKVLEPIRSLIYINPRSVLLTDDTEDLDKMCKTLVVTFDTEALERIRKLKLK